MSKVIKYLEAIFDTIMNISAVFCGVLVIFVMLSVSVDVVMRYFLNSPMFWVGELAEYAMLFITFTGTAWLLKKEGHVTIDILIAVIDSKTRNILGVFTNILGVFICVFLTYYGAVVTWDHFLRGVYNPSLLQFPKAPLIAVIPFGSFLLLIQFMRKTLILLQNLKTN